MEQVEPKNKAPRSPVPIIKGMEDRYGFVQVPRTVQEINFSTGVSFLQGYFQNSIIDKLEIYEKGLLCDARINSNLCDKFLDDLTTWATNEFDLPVKETGTRVYMSQLEVFTELNIGMALSKFRPIGETIAKVHGGSSKPFELSGIRMHMDVTGITGPQPTEFTFERRAGQSYASSVYFSTAPLRTDDHVRVLDELEKLF